MRLFAVLACWLVVVLSTAAEVPTGFNGANWFESQTPQDVVWLKAMLQPGQSFTLRYRADKFDGAMPTDLDSVIALRDSMTSGGKGLDVIFCADMMGDQPQNQMDAINYLLAGGVNVVAVEAGNETYSKSQCNFDFNTYKSKFEPLLNALASAHPAIPFSLFLAPRPKESGVAGGGNDDSSFNNAAITYINSAPSRVAASIHIYFNAFECPVMAALPTTRVYDPATTQSDLNTFYNSLWSQTDLAELWAPTLNYVATSLPGRRLYITESGYVDAGAIKNTIGYGLMSWSVWNTYRNDSRITALLEHNGVAASTPGFITPAKTAKGDINPNGYTNLRRVNYYIYQMLREFPGGDRYAGVLDAAQGTHKYWYVNGAGSAVSLPPVDTSSFRLRCLKGAHIYTTAGYAEWMANGTTPNAEIADITELTSKALPAYSYGWFEYVVPGVSAPDIDVTPGALSFGVCPVGSSSLPSTVTIENQGNADLIFTSITIAGANRNDFGFISGPPSLDPLAASATRRIPIVFQPSAPGVKSANLAIITNDPDEGAIQVTLTGDGIRPAATATDWSCY